tara:strand:+ start:12454 stop:13041 length:588 start_codon:yes stop_codon:yes gene_type:complete
MNQNIISSFNNLSSACETLKTDEIFLRKYDSWIKNLISTIRNEGTIFICGNGGSFAHSQHLTTELVVRFNINREPIRAICLGANQANLTAIGNDFSFDQIFTRELSALYKPRDSVFILSTSGNSQNVIKVAEYVRSMGGNALSLIGKDGGQLKNLTDHYIIPFSSTSLIQELQFLIGHSICYELEKYIVKNPKND